MFGYIRPLITELKVKELEGYKACYCGLCHTLGKEYGLASRFILNYDFVFLAMLLWDKDRNIIIEEKRCVGCVHKKKRCCKATPAMESAAALSIILTWWKLRDEIADEGFLKATVCKAASLFLRRAYNKAARQYPEFDREVRDNLEKLSTLENTNCESIDAAADCFAHILSAAAKSEDKNKSRILEQILYHVGRWIYIIDAYDDFDDDIKSGNYNAVAARFAGKTAIDDEIRERMRNTLMHSRNMAGNSFELLDETPWSGIVRNIIALGMPAVSEAVFTGAWKEKTNRKNYKIGI